ncbi:MAG TPA: YggS family pyridoxal phosphate-dependent enzyme [candidate division WOR-3 bacterium]|uniref:Pyridoxal phosphate homeostasis protein n=1 Tax=candidate division WOR-3 bacterium TaxID=2052148 RepID=A0A9C9K0P3_UNCW3|nr:YggS family pyridoxal phosphate-dependent enzyme [candidate division WOR-3 bacterium]
MTISDNIRKLRVRIERAARRGHRTPDEITLVAVTKTIEVERIEEAIKCGVRIIGENRVQEAKKKFPLLGDKVEWHMIGHLQTNKVKDALKIFSLIHSLDSLKLAREIEKRAENPVACLIEVNTSEEASKFGIDPEQTLDFYASLQEFKKINIKGLMTIGPGWAIEDPEASRPCFKLLYQLREQLRDRFQKPFPILSMGMTSDFEVAIEEGATMIRVGTAIFGPRRY